jgi:hypothetical protein
VKKQQPEQQTLRFNMKELHRDELIPGTALNPEIFNDSSYREE